MPVIYPRNGQTYGNQSWRTNGNIVHSRRKNWSGVNQKMRNTRIGERSPRTSKHIRIRVRIRVHIQCAVTVHMFVPSIFSFFGFVSYFSPPLTGVLSFSVPFLLFHLSCRRQRSRSRAIRVGFTNTWKTAEICRKLWRFFIGVFVNHDWLCHILVYVGNRCVCGSWLTVAHSSVCVLSVCHMQVYCLLPTL